MSDTQPPTLSPQLRKLGIMLAIGVSVWIALMVARPVLSPIPHTATVVKLPPAPTVETPVSPAPPPAPTPPVPTVETSTPPPAAVPVPAPAVEPSASPPASAMRENDAEAIHLLDTMLKSQAEEIERLKSQQQRTMNLLLQLNAYDRLKDALLSGRPFAEELVVLRAQLAGTDITMLTPLEPFAGRGIPKLDALRESFEQILPEALHPPLPDDASFWQRFTANLSRLVTIRRTGAQTGDTTEAIIGRAEAALAHEDMPAATQEIRQLQGASVSAFATWLANADAYAAREHALAALHTAILSSAAP